MIVARFLLLGVFHPADPLVARERRDVFPFLEGVLVDGQCFFQIRRQFMGGAAGNVLLTHIMKYSKSL